MLINIASGTSFHYLRILYQCYECVWMWWNCFPECTTTTNRTGQRCEDGM